MTATAIALIVAGWLIANIGGEPVYRLHGRRIAFRLNVWDYIGVTAFFSGVGLLLWVLLSWAWRALP